MSASEKAARAWLTEARVTVGMFDNDAQRIERLEPSLMLLLATARAEGHRAGMLRAAEIADDLEHYLQDDTEGFRQAAVEAIRAAANEERSEASTAGEGKSHE